MDERTVRGCDDCPACGSDEYDIYCSLADKRPLDYAEWHAAIRPDGAPPDWQPVAPSWCPLRTSPVLLTLQARA